METIGLSCTSRRGGPCSIRRPCRFTASSKSWPHRRPAERAGTRIEPQSAKATDPTQQRELESKINPNAVCDGGDSKNKSPPRNELEAVIDSDLRSYLNRSQGIFGQDKGQWRHPLPKYLARNLLHNYKKIDELELSDLIQSVRPILMKETRDMIQTSLTTKENMVLTKKKPSIRKETKKNILKCQLTSSWQDCLSRDAWCSMVAPILGHFHRRSSTATRSPTIVGSEGRDPRGKGSTVVGECVVLWWNHDLSSPWSLIRNQILQQRGSI